MSFNLNFMFQFPMEVPSSTSPLSSEAVCEAAARLLFMNVKWARSLPAFTALPLRDQVCNIQLHSLHLYTLKCQYLVNFMLFL